MSRTAADEREILAMFSYARPQGSATEDAFITRFLTPLGFERDRHRNLVRTVADPRAPNVRPTVLFSSHVDTVARREGIQTLHYDGKTLALSRRAKRQGFSCLGADDTAGVWLMAEMVKAGVPGVYVIHHGEESGCIGSRDLADNDPDFFAGINIALAFDRAGYADVITHQCGFRTASQGFAWSLARQLGGDYAPSDGGVYTDTNEYALLVPECSNLSVGYHGQHGKAETQDVPFLIDLRDKLLRVDWSKLNVERDPSVEDVLCTGRGWGTSARTRYSWDDDDWWDPEIPDSAYYGEDDGTPPTMKELIRQFPDVAEVMLLNMGVRLDEFAEEIHRQRGVVPPGMLYA